MVQLKIGPVWPKDLLSQPASTAWDASAAGGMSIDNKVAFGGVIDFLWNRHVSERSIATHAYEIQEDVKTFMFPLSGFVTITPLPDLIISPSIWGQVGLNTMYYSKKNTSADTVVSWLDEDGWYMGFIWKIAADAQFTIGENSSLFAGIEYQGSKNNKLGVKSNDVVVRRDMSGVGLRMGLKASY